VPIIAFLKLCVKRSSDYLGVGLKLIKV